MRTVQGPTETMGRLQAAAIRVTGLIFARSNGIMIEASFIGPGNDLYVICTTAGPAVTGEEVANL